MTADDFTLLAEDIAKRVATYQNGTPDTWLQIRPAAVATDPSSGTIPVGPSIWSTTIGSLKRPGLSAGKKPLDPGLPVEEPPHQDTI